MQEMQSVTQFVSRLRLTRREVTMELICNHSSVDSLSVKTSSKDRRSLKYLSESRLSEQATAITLNIIPIYSLYIFLIFHAFN